MAARSRAKKSLSPIRTTERLITKKEMEEYPERYKTCPPIIKKSQTMYNRSLKKKACTKGKGEAKAVFFSKPTSLNSLYDPTEQYTYLCQLYNIWECIGEGSFGVVYKVRSLEDGKSYAIKLMKKCSSQSVSYEEVKRLEKIGDHDNVVKFFCAWEEHSVVCMKMELCAVSLGTYTKTNHEIALDQLWIIFIDMLHALKYLHGRGLIHLDIKPDNIMMSADGKYKLGDFGLLMDLNEPIRKDLKAYQASEGDAKYLAKEALEGTYTPAADIFSLGISMLELAADLVLPVNGPLWHMLRDGSFSSHYFKLVPFQIRTVMTKMMAPDHIHRLDVVQVFSLRHVKRAVAERATRSRINYYQIWKAQHMDDSVQPVAVCINPPNENFTPPTNKIKATEEMTVDEESPSTSVCLTPPKRVSQVLLYSI